MKTTEIPFVGSSNQRKNKTKMIPVKIKLNGGMKPSILSVLTVEDGGT